MKMSLMSKSYIVAIRVMFYPCTDQPLSFHTNYNLAFHEDSKKNGKVWRADKRKEGEKRGRRIQIFDLRRYIRALSFFVLFCKRLEC